MPSRILVVEDEPSIADNITYALSTEGFEAKWCATGGEALEIIKQEQIALIILDIGLPDIQGFDLAKEIRKNNKTPIIFVTARSEEIDRVLGLELGGDDYIVKPFSPRELTARVKAVLRRFSDEETNSSERVSEELKYGSFSIDSFRFQIKFHEELLDLSRYEYRLLEVLVRTPGRVFSREQLMNLVWEEPEMSLERTVDTHVKTIRKKLREISAETEEIITHRGIGYSLREAE